MSETQRGSARFRKGARYYNNDLDSSKWSQLAEVLNRGAYDSEVFTSFALRTLENLRRTMSAIRSRYPPRAAIHDPTLYTGGAGVSIFFYHVWRKLQRLSLEPALEESLRQAIQQVATSALSNAEEYSSMSTQGLSQSHQRGTFRWDQVIAERGPSVFCGHAGVYIANALVEHAKGNVQACRKSVENFVSVGQFALPDAKNQAPRCPDEILYGSAGYLLGWLYLRRELGPDADSLQLAPVEDIVEYLLMRGSVLAEACQIRMNILLYEWHDSMYMGFAHGLMGILSALLEVCATLPPESQQAQSDMLLKNTLNFIFSQRGQDGYYDTRVKLHDRHKNYEQGSTDSKRLVQWCHGSPGAVFLCASAHRKYPTLSNIIDEALLAGQVTWREGLLRKGPGLCHGIGGNAYALLLCYQICGNTMPDALEWLKRALAFADFLVSHADQRNESPNVSTGERIPWMLYGEGTRIPDHPYSLFEGIAGFGCLLVDLLQPKDARTPPC
ncbi:hypothetical protein CCYA_CCYA07G2201 [Cyanidiococcus yangmingshanensis]|nr:hypothetical protein CCYA_CCYA07G2201 [Cyanidiococcus yangmingshanensis]